MAARGQERLDGDGQVHAEAQLKAAAVTARPLIKKLNVRNAFSGGTIWFVSRHPGAVEWAARRGLTVDRQIAHLETGEVEPGDIVIGTLSVNLAAEVCRRGARYLNLSLDLPESARGRELTADEVERFGARLEPFMVERGSCASDCGRFADAVSRLKED